MKPILPAARWCVVACFFTLLCAACDTAAGPKPRGGAANTPNNGAAVDPDPDEAYDKESGVPLQITLKAGGESKQVTVPRGRGIIGGERWGGKPPGGVTDNTVWIEEPAGTVSKPEDIVILPLKAGAVFIPWEQKDYPPGYTRMELIRSLNDLSQIKTRLANGINDDTIFVLAKDFDVNTWNNQIGSEGTPFSGWFNGAGYTLSKLKLPAGAARAALFGCVAHGRVENLRVTLENTSALGVANEDCYISPVAALVVDRGQSKEAVFRRIAVTMNGASKTAAINAGAPSDGKKVVIGGVVAGLASAKVTRIEECAAFIRVKADTGFAASQSITARLAVGGIVGEITGSGKTYITDNYALGEAELSGNAEVGAGGQADNYPKIAGGIAGYIGNGPTSEADPSRVARNYAQFTIGIVGGSGVNPAQSSNIFSAAGGIIGAKYADSPEQKNARLAVSGNFVMTRSLSTVTHNTARVRRIMYNKADGTNGSPDGNCAVTNNQGNFAYNGMELKDNTNDKAVPVADPPSAVFDGAATAPDLFIDRQNYDFSAWDFDGVWAMGVSYDIVYSMSTYADMKTDKARHYGAYPYPLQRWLAGLVPAPPDFSPVAYLQYDADGFDGEGFDKWGYHREPPYLDRSGYDKDGVYGGLADGAEYYSYDAVEKDAAAFIAGYSMGPPGFRWSKDTWATETAAVMPGDNFNPQTVPVPKDHGRIPKGDYEWPPAQGKLCPWIDKNADGWHDMLGVDKSGFAKDGRNIYGYDRQGLHADGYANGKDKWGLPPPFGYSVEE